MGKSCWQSLPAKFLEGSDSTTGEKGSYLSPGMTDLNFQGAKWDASTQWEYE